MSDGAPWAAGGCSCGAVRYGLASAPYWTHCCHCRVCQRQTGAAFAINAMIEADRVTATGEVEDVDVPSPSGFGQTITRCATCKTALWSIYRRLRAIRFLRAGTLDDPALVTPDIHIYTDSKLPWVAVPDGARQVPDFYDYDATWPEAALARRRAALGH